MPIPGRYSAADRIVIGGASPAAYRRAVTRGHGWYDNGRSPEDLVRHLTGLHRAADQIERPSHLGRLEISFLSLAPAVENETVQLYA